MLCAPSPLSYQPFSTLQELSGYKNRKKYYSLFKIFSSPKFSPAPMGLSALESCLCDQETGCPPIKGDKLRQTIVFPIIYMKSELNKVELDLPKRSVTNGKLI